MKKLFAADRPPVIRLYTNEVVVDNFAGGGGASTGIEMALGRSPDVAINHDADAIAMHRANHPTTQHITDDVFHVDPVKALNGKRCGLAWFSPDCTYFSKAKGGQPFRDPSHARRVRGLIGVVLKWVSNPATRPRIVIIENVEEIEHWCRIGPDGRPDPARRGEYWRRWCARMRGYGATLEWRRLAGCDFGAPTTRRRLFIIARFDGEPIHWPVPTHGPSLVKRYRSAAECIDFSLPVPSIFLTPAEAKTWAKAHGVETPRRPLADATLRRVARGVHKFVLTAADPFIVPVVHGGDDRVHSMHEPLRTIVASDREFALVVPTLINTRNGERRGQAPRVFDIMRPYGTVTAQGSQGALVAAFLAKHNGGHEATGQRLVRSMDAITTRDQKALATCHLLKLYGTCQHGATADEPMPAVTANGNHIAAVYALLMKFYGSAKSGKSLRLPLDVVPTRDRFALVTVTIAGEEYVIVDIGMRMLAPRELFLAQGFPDVYRIDSGIDEFGEPVAFTKKTQTRLCGNSVNPQIPEALIEANCPPIVHRRTWRDEAVS